MSFWAAGVAAAVSITTASVGAAKSAKASQQAGMAANMDAAARANEEQEGLVDALWASFVDGANEVTAAQSQTTDALLQMLATDSGVTIPV